MPVNAPSLTPVVAQPVVLPASGPEIVASSSAIADAGTPMLAAPESSEIAAGGSDASGVARASGGWLSPEGALTGEFGELLDEIPSRPTAEAPVFPTPPAPWPAVPTPIASADAIAEDPFFGGMDIDAELASPAAPAVAPVEVPDASASRGDAGYGTWTPEASEVAIPHEASEVPGLLDTSASEGEVWADAYGAEVDAIHGLEATSQGAIPPSPEFGPGDAAAGGVGGGRTSNWWEAETASAVVEESVGEAAGYLAAEWPEPTPTPDPSTLPTPVLGVPALESSWTGRVPGSEPLPPAVPAEATAEPGSDFAWSAVDADSSAAASTGVGIEHGAGEESWEFAPPAEAGGSLHAQPTSSSLAAAEALELVAAQLRNGTLRADGYSPALGEAAALSAVLAALLGIDARWDVPR